MVNKVLVLSPHCDDSELACGGSISRWLSEGKEVVVAVFSNARQALAEENLHEKVRVTEFTRAAKLLDITRFFIFDYPIRCFNSHRQAILDDLIKLNKDVSPDLVLMPSSKDSHQDHEVLRNEGFRAFKRVSLLGYEMPQNNRSFPADQFVKLHSSDLTNKIAAINCYKSQLDKPFMAEDYIRGMARVRGMQCGAEYAEAYEVIRRIE